MHRSGRRKVSGFEKDLCFDKGIYLFALCQQADLRNLILRGCSADYDLRKDEMSEPDEELNQPASPTTDQQLRKIKEYLLESW